MLDRGQGLDDTHGILAAVKTSTLDRGHEDRDTQGSPAAVNPREPGQIARDAQARSARLTFFAALLDDLESVRKASENRAGALERREVIPQGLTTVVDGLAKCEHYAELELRRALREHPLGAWVAASIGIGEKQGARLIAAIGDPAWNDRDDRPRRGPAELWAYCGYKPGQKRQKGVVSNWNATAKMRAYLCAVSCLKQARSPYRAVYDARRAHTAETHPDWTPGHSHNDALHIVAKEILKDLWRAAATFDSTPKPATPQPVGALA